ncbi:Tripartite tricarboxylate transporter TctB family protein [Pseudorhodobacter antarcticus]|jgi:hypothetical protein|uniref:Tripartite tricarboxylate transporter TctB family protein n=1 Tax=Pseudorhodobacter antarcticus TaxID=1077947 RepID=A0A1H8HGL7_9RHOB|nr:tripartite tricarboxylate transporter TctB family protein [Pseudorhodobacter antarcticus]SEN55343.1 Tripartite tricarboxylate transporter TctB family protein [Pseudorhodobacter antarcticus]
MQPQNNRRPGELAFALFLAGFSAFLLYTAYGISGFEALSAPGAIPMAATAAMLITAGLVVVQTLRKPAAGLGFWRFVLPPIVVVVMVGLLAFAAVLKPLGFLPVSALFLVLTIKLLSRRGWGYSVAIGLGCLLVIYLTFRVGFSVLMPPGIVPEGEMLAWFRGLLGGGR